MYVSGLYKKKEKIVIFQVLKVYWIILMKVWPTDIFDSFEKK
jgi:hypothetical protein